MSMPIFIRLGCLFLLTTGVLFPGAASAQWRYMFPTDFTLTKEDLRLQREVILRLVRAVPPSVGQSEDWANPRSGARGTVILLGTSEIRRMPCRRLRFHISTPDASEPYDVTFTLCRVSEGVWKIA